MKGILHEPRTKPTMKPESRDALLTAIAKARGWIDDIRLGHIASFAMAQRRRNLTVTGLAKALPYSWAEQERAILQNTQLGSANPGEMKGV